MSLMQPQLDNIQSSFHTNNSCANWASDAIYCCTGESETFSPKAGRGTRSPRRHPAAVSYDDYDTATHSSMAPPSGMTSYDPQNPLGAKDPKAPLPPYELYPTPFGSLLR